MINPFLLATTLSIFLTFGQLIHADSSFMPTHLNPQLGISDFQYTGQGEGHSELTGGATVEFGEGVYRVEAGLLIIRTSSSATWIGEPDRTPIHSNFLTIPMLWKARVFSTALQSWSLKLGAIQAYELSSNKSEYTNRIDVLASFGVSGRLAFSHSTDFIVEASYNRGLLPALRTTSTDVFNEGTMVLLGLSFRL